MNNESDRAPSGASTDGTAMPVVTVYPICSACGAPYVLRHGFLVMDGGREQWLWQRDCKHKKAPPVVNPGNAAKAALKGFINGK